MFKKQAMLQMYLFERSKFKECFSGCLEKGKYPVDTVLSSRVIQAGRRGGAEFRFHVLLFRLCKSETERKAIWRRVVYVLEGFDGGGNHLY